MRNLPFADKCFSLCGFIQNDLIFSFQMENRCGTLWDMCRTCFHISVIIKRQLRHYRIQISFFHLLLQIQRAKKALYVDKLKLPAQYISKPLPMNIIMRLIIYNGNMRALNINDFHFDQFCVNKLVSLVQILIC